MQPRKLVINIRGTHGSGKTTLAKRFLLPDALELTWDNKPKVYGHVSRDGVALVGPYLPGRNCGGGDALRDKEHPQQIIELLLKRKDVQVVVIEAMTITASWLRWWLYDRVLLKRNIEFVWAMLPVTQEVAVQRIAVRNGGKPLTASTHKAILSKIKCVRDHAARVQANGGVCIELPTEDGATAAQERILRAYIKRRLG